MTHSCWALSNVAAEGPQQKGQLFRPDQDFAIVRHLIEYAQNSRWEIQKEAIYAVCHLLVDNTARQMDILERHGALKVLPAVLEKWTEVDLMQTGLTALEAVLEFSLANNVNYHQRLIDLGVGDKLEALVNHRNQDIWQTASHLLNTYWTRGEDNDDDEEEEETASDTPKTEANENVACNSWVKTEAGFPSQQPSETRPSTKRTFSDVATTTHSDRERLGERVLNDKE